MGVDPNHPSHGRPSTETNGDDWGSPRLNDFAARLGSFEQILSTMQEVRWTKPPKRCRKVQWTLVARYYDMLISSLFLFYSFFWGAIDPCVFFFGRGRNHGFLSRNYISEQWKGAIITLRNSLWCGEPNNSEMMATAGGFISLEVFKALIGWWLKGVILPYRPILPIL